MGERSEWFSILFGPHATRVLVSVVAVLSFTTGLLNIGAQQVSGPFASVIPLWLQGISGFTGALTGFLVLGVMIGLWGRYRAAWDIGIIVVPLTIIQGILQSSILSIPLIVVAALATVELYYNRHRFQRRIGLTLTQKASLGAIIGAQIYGTVGAYALRHEFTEELTLIDAFYYSIVTMSTVGYGEIAPLTTTSRLFAVSLIIVGVSSFTAFIGSLLGPLIQHHLPQRIERRQKQRNE